MGTNTGFFAYWSADRPFVDQMKAASVVVNGYNPGTIVENSSIALDANKYPTITNRAITVLFFSNGSATTPNEILPSGNYVIMWDGEASNIRIDGQSVTGKSVSPNRAQLTLNTSRRGSAYFVYRNVRGKPHVHNIRIVPQRYEAAYKNWSWSNYQVGSASNPPIFFPEWIDKMKRSCVIRYMNSQHTNDRDAIRRQRDSTKTRIKPAYSAWYTGFGIGSGSDRAHIWPPELIAEATRQTGATPWINFAVTSYDSLKRGDSYIRDIARLFRDNWNGPIYTEYGNEIWNTAHPFHLATNFVRDNGPGRNRDINENYALRSNAVQKAFADAYDGNGCKSLGVLATQGRVPHRGNQVMRHADLNYIDVVSPATYVGKDLKPGNDMWNFVTDMYNQSQSGRPRSQVFDEIRTEILTGSRGIVNSNWRNDVRGFLQQYLDMAKTYGVCSAFYEGGLHMRVDRVNRNNAGHMTIAKFAREYQRSHQQGQVEKEINDWLKSKGAGPNVVYSSFASAGWGTFSYWDSVFEKKNVESPRAQLIGAYRGGSNTPISTPRTPTPQPPPPGGGDQATPPGSIQCGQPSFNRNGAHQYLWQNCRSGAWQIIATGGGAGDVRKFSGRYRSGQNIRNVKKFVFESTDWVRTHGANEISFSMSVSRRDSDALSFRTNNNASQCLTLNPQTGTILFGKNAKSVSGSFNPMTGGPCG